MEERQAQISIELRKRFPEGSADVGLMEEAVQELIALRSEYEELQRKLLFWSFQPTDSCTSSRRIRHLSHFC